MDTKWKNWTATGLVKIVCFILLPVIIFGAAVNVYQKLTDPEIWSMSAQIDERVFFSGADSPEAFYSARFQPLLWQGYLLTLVCGGEEAIKNGDYIDITTEKRREEDGSTVRYIDYQIITDKLTGSFSKFQQNNPNEEARFKKQLIDNQLYFYRSNMDYLQKEHLDKGLLYYIENTADGTVATNIAANITNAEEFFRTLPRNYLNGYSVGYMQSPPAPSGYNVYLGYEQKAVNLFISEWERISGYVWNAVIQTLVCLAAALFLFIVMLCGAGRRNGTEKVDGRKRVFFTIFDKPYLDISFVLLFVLEAVVIYAAATFQDRFSMYGASGTVVIIYIALIAVLTLTPLNAWLCSFAKRCKAGKFWRHTFIYNFFRFLIKGAVYLWSGIRFVGQAVVITFALFIVMLFAIENRAAEIGVLLTLAVLIILLVHFKRLQKIKAGTVRAVAGNYTEPINVNYGELGKIANNINNISIGIDAAVKIRTKAERMKTELITNVSHDIRTPLTSIITYTDLLKNDGFENERASEYLDIIIKKSARLKDLTDELFEAAKASSGNIDVDVYTLDFAALVTQSVGEIEEKIAASGLEFRLNLPLKAEVTADGKLLSRILENLFGNALKYALPKTRVYVDLTEAGSEFRLDIKNISAEPLPANTDELTERFTRGDSARTSEGSGLGLSIVESFAAVQGGRFGLGVDGDLFKASVYLPKPGAALEPAEAVFEQVEKPRGLLRKRVEQLKNMLNSKKEW
ncbi:MAG: HAMP domain-containing histidine kinase [Oscillospiraceae bacterium]|nr:HAMP domain-containing histidine kinase [Oscillospiraceae bacterium]